MILVIGFAAIGIWVAYLAWGLLIAKVCAAGAARVRAFYWVLPFVVGTLTASAFSLTGENLKATLGFGGWLTLVVVMTLFGYFFQWIVQMYIFKCGACAITCSTYGTAWRRGIYTCPNCKPQYFQGVLGPA